MNARVLLLLACVGACSAHATTPNDYAYAFPIDTGNVTGSAWRVELTPPVYAWTRDAALRDIEVFNADAQPVPFGRFATQPAVARTQSAPLPLLALPASNAAAAAGDLRLVIDRDAAGRLRRIDAGESTSPPTPAGTREWLLDASAIEHPLDSLVLAWGAPTSGMVARFRVEAGDDLQSWRTVGNGTLLALEQDGARLERHDIALGNVRAKYLRLQRLDDGTELVGLAVQAHWYDGLQLPARSWIDAAVVPAAPHADAPPPGVTRFDYALPAALPLDAARIDLSSDNALAPVTLFAHLLDGSVAEWRELARLNAFRLRSGDEILHNADVDLAASQRVRELRIEARAPLATAPRLALGYRPDTFVFLAQGPAPFTLVVGSAHAQRIDYPIDAALSSLRAQLGKDWQPPLASLGTMRESGGSAALKPIAPPTPWRRWLLWGVLLAGAVVVAGFALSLLRGERS